MSEYGCFAQYYDLLTDNVEYEKIAARYDELVCRFGGRREILLDLGCGTGSLSESMSRLGYDVIGVDSSEEMLNTALNKKYDSGLNIQYLLQDMRKLDMFGTIDVTVSALDCFNHLDSLDDIKKAFERVSLFAFPDGLFIFDMNTPYKHEMVLSNNAYIYERDEVYCVWQNFFEKENNTVTINLDFFIEEDGMYHRESESFCERAYNSNEIKRLLEETGFELLGEYDGFEENPPNEKSERIVYVAKKVK